MVLFCSSTQSWLRIRRTKNVNTFPHHPHSSLELPHSSHPIGPPVHNTLRSKRIPSAPLPALASPLQPQRIAKGRRNEAHKA